MSTLNHRDAGRRIERPHVRARAEQTELLHVEEDDVHRAPQHRIPQGLGHAQKHQHPGAVVDHAVAEGTRVQSVGIEVGADHEPRRSGAETDHDVVTAGTPVGLRACPRERLHRVRQIPLLQLRLQGGEPQVVRRLHEAPRDVDYVVRERRRRRFGRGGCRRSGLGSGAGTRPKRNEKPDENACGACLHHFFASRPRHNVAPGMRPGADTRAARSRNRGRGGRNAAGGRAAGAQPPRVGGARLSASSRKRGR